MLSLCKRNDLGFVLQCTFSRALSRGAASSSQPSPIFSQQDEEAQSPSASYISHSSQTNGKLCRSADRIDNHVQCLVGEGQLGVALDLVSGSERVLLPHTYRLLLKACYNGKAFVQATQLLAHLISYCARLMGQLTDHLLTSLVEFEDVEHMSDWRSSFSVYCWNVMISACVKCGYNQEALKLYQHMHEHGVEPNRYTFLSLFKACGNAQDLVQGKKLLADACSWEGFVADVFIASTLVSMYSKCGAISEAEDVFGAMLEYDIVSWNAMLSGYVEGSQPEKALKLYRQLQEQDGGSKNQLTYVTALQACGAIQEEALVLDGRLVKVMSFEIGRALHAEAWRNGYSTNPYVVSALLNMYSKTGGMAEAENVFDASCQHDVVSWNVMLSAYVEQGQGGRALQMYRQMEEEGIDANERTLVFCLQACGILAEEDEVAAVEGGLIKPDFLEIGLALHADIRRKGFKFSVFISSALVSMYGKCGSILEAEVVFRASCEHDVVLWTAMLSAYVEQNQAEKALLLYRQMDVEGVSPDDHTFMFALQACGILAERCKGWDVQITSTPVMSLEIGRALHADACKRGLRGNLFVGTTIVIMYARCGAISEAQNVFRILDQGSIVLWNAMLSSYIEHHHGERALQLYARMHELGLNSDQFTFVMALQACSVLVETKVLNGGFPERMSLEVGQALHADARNKGLASHACVGSSLVSMYGKCGAITEAGKVFWALPHRPLATWNAMLSVYTEQGQSEKAMNLFQRMQKECKLLDDITMIRVLQTCGSLGRLRICKQLHFDAVCSNYDEDASMAATLIHSYGSCASIEDAEATFHKLCGPDLVSWNACIASHGGIGDLLASLHTYEYLGMEGVNPNEVTFASLLAVCSYSGLVIDGLCCVEMMTMKHGLRLNSIHHGIMLDLLGRSGDFKRIENMFKVIPMEASPSMWSSILTACRIHGNVELAKRAFDYAVSLQPDEPSVYVMVSNIYADADY